VNVRVPKLEPPRFEYIEKVTGPLTSISNSTAAIDVSAWLREIRKAGLNAQVFRDVAAVLEEKEAVDKRGRVTVRFERRDDGGLLIYSDDVPGLVLSHRDPRKALEDLIPALKIILSHRYGAPVDVRQLPESIPTEREYEVLAA
jgi:hypothetical protein